MSRRRTISDCPAAEASIQQIVGLPTVASTSKFAIDYDPFENRNVQYPNTYLESLMNLVKVAVGTGILAIPMAYSNSGLLMGTIFMILITFLNSYCIHILVATSREICQSLEIPVLGYGETVEKVFENGPIQLRKHSRLARNFVDCAMLASTFSGSVYIVFMAETTMGFMNHVFHVGGTERIYILIVTIPVLLMAQVRELKHIAPFSLCANVFLFSAFGITLYYVFGGTITLGDKPLIVSMDKWPFAMSTMIFAVTSIRNVVSIENEMKKPEQFLGPLGVLNVSSYIIATLYVIIGFFGFSRFGYDIKGSITLNLPNELLALCAQVLISVAILFSMGLMIHTAMEVIGKKWGEVIYKERETLVQVSLRISIVFLLFIFAILVPNLKVFISLTGVIFLGSLSILIPAVIETIHRFPTRRYGFWKWKLFMNAFLVFFYLLTLITGVYVDIGEIINLYSN